MKEEFQEEWFAKLEARIDLAKLKHLIVNHTEPDHSGSIKELLRRAPHLVVHGSRAALQFLSEQVNMEFQGRLVGENDILDLGSRKLRFIMAPFLHWPDTIWTYLEGEGVLFTCDGFLSLCFPEGKILASQQEVTSLTVEYYSDKIGPPLSPRCGGLGQTGWAAAEMIATGGPILDVDLSALSGSIRNGA